MISFTIVDVTYQAEEGMTWLRWVNSKYNADTQFNVYFIDESNRITHNGISHIAYDDYNYVYSDHIIESDYIYEYTGGTDPA